MKMATDLFHHLPPDVRASVSSRCETRAFEKGHAIFREGDRADAVWLVQRGCVYLVKHNAGSKQPATIFLMTPEDCLCGISALGHERYSAGAVAATATELIRIPTTLFRQWLDSYSSFASAVALALCTRLRHLGDSIVMAQAPVDRRVASVLLRLRSNFGNTIPVTHHELARMAGTRWETSIRTIGAMKRQGWVASGRGRLRLLHPRELERLACGAIHINGHLV